MSTTFVLRVSGQFSLKVNPNIVTLAPFTGLSAAGRLGFVICENGVPVGLLHYCPLWDNLPFLNLIVLLPEHRRRGIGRRAMALWEEEMSRLGYRMALTSTQADEDAQFFYRRLHYRDCGVLVLNDCPLAQPAELFLCKTLPAPPA